MRQRYYDYEGVKISRRLHNKLIGKENIIQKVIKKLKKRSDKNEKE